MNENVKTQRIHFSAVLPLPWQQSIAINSSERLPPPAVYLLRHLSILYLRSAAHNTYTRRSHVVSQRKREIYHKYLRF